MAVEVTHVPERIVEGKRLGVAGYKEDERNKDYAFMARVDAPVPITDVHHERHIHVMNQNIDVTVNGKVWHGLGSCCSNALLGTVSTGPFKAPFANPHEQSRIVPIYEAVSRLSGNPDLYFPPNDKGAYVQDAMDYAKTKGWIGEYRWAYSLDEFLQALMHGPCQLSMAWPDSFDRAGGPKFVRGDHPYGTGNELVFKEGSPVRGWHSVVADQVVHSKRRIWMTNSWGKYYCNDGRMFFSYDTVEQLFATNNLQVAVPVPLAA